MGVVEKEGKGRYGKEDGEFWHLRFRNLSFSEFVLPSVVIDDMTRILSWSLCRACGCLMIVSRWKKGISKTTDEIDR